jgi:hypothetical protein
MRNPHKIWLDGLKGRNNSEDFSINRRTILKQISEKHVREHALDSSGSGKEPVAGSCEHGNKHP